MNGNSKFRVVVLVAALAGSASPGQASDRERGCGARPLPQKEYRDLRQFAPDSYAPEHVISWAADHWLDRGGQMRYQNDVQAYGSQYARDPYAAYNGELEDYPDRYGESAAETDRYARDAPAYFQEIPAGYYDQVYPVHGDARYGDEYEYILSDQYPGYNRDRLEMLNKQTAYMAGRVYTSPQNVIVDQRSSAFYRGGDSLWPNRKANAETVSNAYYPRHGQSVDNTQKMSAMPAQGWK